MDCYICKRKIRGKLVPGPGPHSSHIRCWNAWHDAMEAKRKREQQEEEGRVKD
ncbi:MAG: hypothetical protein J4F28_02145 [Nitrosopumilaceae archaeon]|nr:hypothetical protein [Nitrosopumilaceae archaeon]